MVNKPNEKMSAQAKTPFACGCWFGTTNILWNYHCVTRVKEQNLHRSWLLWHILKVRSNIRIISKDKFVLSFWTLLGIATIIFLKLGLNLSLSNKKSNLAKEIQICLVIVSQSLGLHNSLSILCVKKIILVIFRNSGIGFIRNNGVNNTHNIIIVLSLMFDK